MSGERVQGAPKVFGEAEGPVITLLLSSRSFHGFLYHNILNTKFSVSFAKPSVS